MAWQLQLNLKGPKGDQGDPGVQGPAGVVQAVVAGANVAVDATDPANPIVSSSNPGGVVQAVVAGARVGVDSTDPANPIVSADVAAWADITGKPATFPPTLPIAQADVTGLVADQAAQDAAIALKADTTYVDAADALKAPLASPPFTGVPTVPTAAPGTNTLQAASTAFVVALVDTLSAVYQPISAALISWAAVVRAAGFDAFVAAPSSANLRALLTDETGTGLAYFQGGALGTPASGVATNLTGLPLTSGVTGSLPIANGGTAGTTAATARTNLGIGSMATRALTISTAAPSGGADGDVWFQYTP